MSQEEETKLIRLSQKGDSHAFEKLLRHHIGYIAKIASEYRQMGIEYEDLLGEGLVGFVQAVHRFRPERRNRFISYAYWWIRKNILLTLSNESSPFYVPHYRQQRIFRLRRAEAVLIQELGRRPTLHELAIHMRASPRQLQSLLETGNVRFRAEDAENQLSGYRNDRRPNSSPKNGSDPLLTWLEQESRSDLRKAVRTLPNRERTILVRRFGLGAQDPLTLGEIARGMGLTKERVRQIETRAIGLLKTLYLRKSGNPDYHPHPPGSLL